MTEKQIEKIKIKIKQIRAALTAEKRLYGGFHDGNGRRYYISDLYLQIADYKGAITYKKWFDKNFPDDIGDAMISMNWSIAYHGLGKTKEAEVYTIHTSFQNIYLHGFLLDRSVERIDIYEPGYDLLEYTKSQIKEFRKVVTKSYLDWLSGFVETDVYKIPINRFIAISKLLKDESDPKSRIKLYDAIRDLEKANMNKIK
jgi:hypothetical protein